MILCLLITEQNNELLLKNHQSRPAGSMSLLETNATSVQTLGHEQGQGRGRGRGRGRGHGKHNSSHRSGSQSKKEQLKPPEVE